MRNFFLFLLVIGSLSSCSILQKLKQPILNEATSINKEAKKIGEQVSALLEELIQQSYSIQVQGRQLTREEIGFVDQVNEIRGEYQNWQYAEPRLPSYEDNIRLKEKESILKQQEDWKEEIRELNFKVLSI